MKKYKSGTVIGVFGLPCTGKTTVIKSLIQSSHEIIAHISSGDIARRLSTEADTKHMASGNLFPHETMLREEIYNTVMKRRASGAELIFIDGLPRTTDQIQYMLEAQFLGGPVDFKANGILDGCLIQVRADNLLKRAIARNRDDQDAVQAIQKKIAVQMEEINKMDKFIGQMAIPYYTVINNDLTTATINLAKILGLRK